MARRPTLRMNVAIECLESREVLTAGGPTAEMQELLELANFARQKPAEAANWAVADLQTDNLGFTLKTFGVSIDRAKADIASKAPSQPLAWSESLTEAATVMSRAQAERGVQTHDGGGNLGDGTPVGVTLNERLTNAHFDEAISQGENAFAYARSAKNATKAFLIDWGNDRNVLPHLNTITNPANREAGFGVVDTKAKGLGPKVVTQVFGARAGAKPMLVGVAFNDVIEADRLYQAGEGQGDVTVDVTNESGQTQTVNTWKSGGYQVALDKGRYTVTGRVGDRIVRSQSIVVNDQNVKVDFVLSDPWSGATLAAPPAPVVVVPKPAPAPAPVAPPTPVPAPAPAPVVVVEVPRAVVISEAPKVTIISEPVETPRQVTPVATPVVTAVAHRSTAAPADLNSERLIWESW